MAVVATGFFDGVHSGHRRVMDALLGEANARAEESVVVTLWPHPRMALQQDARELRLLTSLDEKVSLIKGLGIDRVEVLDFSREFSAMTAKEYLRDVLQKRFGATTVVVGYDNRLGSDKATPQEVSSIARELGLRVICPQPVSYKGWNVSSTIIRNTLLEGSVDEAAAMLETPYSLFGVVVAGNRIGRTIGYPTANMQLREPLKLVPCNGTYLVNVWLGARKYRGLCNIGVRPTVGQNGSRTIETHILDFSEDIYGLDMKIEFLSRLRGEQRFDSLDALKEQLRRDEALARSFTF